MVKLFMNERIDRVNKLYEKYPKLPDIMEAAGLLFEMRNMYGTSGDHEKDFVLIEEILEKLK